MAYLAVQGMDASETMTLVVQDLPDGQEQITWDAERHPVILLRDARTGEVRGILRGGNAIVESAPGETEIRFPDVTRDEKVRHTRIPE